MQNLRDISLEPRVMSDAEYEFGIEIKCLRCGSEDFTLQGGCRFSCDGCRDTYLIRYEEAGSEGDVRSESLSAGVHEASGRREKGSVYFISTDAPDSPIKIGHTSCDRGVPALELNPQSTCRPLAP